MAALEMPANGEASHNVGEDIIHKALDSVEDRQQKVSLQYCLPLIPVMINNNKIVIKTIISVLTLAKIL